MAIPQAELSQLYKQYLGRDLTPEQYQEIQTSPDYAGFDTADKFRGLLQNTASSVKSKAIADATAQRDQLANAPDPSTYDIPSPQAPPSYQDYTQNYPGLSEAMGLSATAAETAGQAEEYELATPSRVRSKLKTGKGAFYFGETGQDMHKKYSDPDSPFYVPDPNQRMDIVNRAQDDKIQTMNDVVTNIQSIYSVLTAAAKNEAASKKDKVDDLLKIVEKSYDTMLALYGEEMADVRQQRSDAAEAQRAREAEERQYDFLTEQDTIKFGRDKELLELDAQLNPPSGGGTTPDPGGQTPSGLNVSDYNSDVLSP